MKKYAIGLGLFCMPFFAQAQTSVTLFGLLDGGIQHQSVDIDNVGKATRTGMGQSVRAGNRWGLRGTEDLGNGVKALFWLEQGFNLNNGAVGDPNHAAFNRQAYMGLSSDSLGTMTLGRQYNAGFLYFGSFGAFGTGYGLAGISRIFSSAFVRYNNMLKYETPNIGGFKATVGYSRDADIGNGPDDVKALTAGVMYGSGPLRLTATYDRVSDIPGLGGAEKGTLKAWNAAAAWDFDVGTLTLFAGQDIDGRINNMANLAVSPLGNVSPAPNARYMDGFKAKNYGVSFKAPLGGGHLLAAWGMSDSNLDVVTAGGNGIATQHSYSLGYDYSLSKRTSIYLVGTYMKNPTYISNSNAQEYSIGLVHRF